MWRMGGEDGVEECIGCELWLTNLCEQSIYKSADVYVHTTFPRYQTHECCVSPAISSQ